MMSHDVLERFIRSGSIGMLGVGLFYAEALERLGPAEQKIDDADPVYRYADIELYVDGSSGRIWMIQLEPFRARVRLAISLGVGEALEVPSDRPGFEAFLKMYGIHYETGEFHVPGQDEIKISDSGVMILFFEDGSIASLAAVGEIPRHVRRGHDE